jgi:hypothetical protein
MDKKRQPGMAASHQTYEKRGRKPAQPREEEVRLKWIDIE